MRILWRVLIPLVIHVLNGLFVRSYLSLLITLLPHGANLFDQRGMLQIRGGGTPLAHLLLYIKAYQGRIENTKLKQSAEQVLKTYGTLLDYRTLNPSNGPRDSQRDQKVKSQGVHVGISLTLLLVLLKEATFMLHRASQNSTNTSPR